jgi:hypothetical protein
LRRKPGLVIATVALMSVIAITVPDSSSSLAGALTPASGAGAAAPSSAPSSIWTVEPSVNPDPGGVDNSYFAGVSASGPDEAWAVGTYGTAKALDQPLAEHWNGNAWKRVSVPEPAGQQALFDAVDDLGPDNSWAVGTSFGGGVGATAAGETLIEHWNGTVWSMVPSPNGVPYEEGNTNLLDAIAGTSPDDLWVAGWYNDNDADTLALLFEHWNGSTWSALPTPTPGGGIQIATGITVVSADDVWAVGTDGDSQTLAVHWNGSSWAFTSTPDDNSKDAQNELTAVSAFGADDIWASGYAYNVNDENFAVPYVLHWTGSGWKMTKTPNLGTEGSRLRGIEALSATDVWSVGQEQKDNGSILSLTEQFNGSKWAVVSSPDPGMLGKLVDNSLSSVASATNTGTGDSDLFAAGAQEKKGQCCLRTLIIGTTKG